MKIDEFITYVKENTNTELSKAKLKDVMYDILNCIEAALSEGKSVKIKDFGTFEMKKKQAKAGVNPVTQEKIEIPEKIVPSFKMSSNLKKRLTIVK